MSITVMTCAEDRHFHSVISNIRNPLTTFHSRPYTYTTIQSQKIHYRRKDSTSRLSLAYTSSDHKFVLTQLRLRGGYDFTTVFEMFRQKSSNGRSLVDMLWDGLLNKSIVTTIILVVNLAAFALAHTGILGSVDVLYCCPYDVVQNPAAKIYQPIISSFMHLSPGHLVSNMVFWSVVGQSLEQRYGLIRMSTIVCAALVLVGIFQVTISLFLSALASIPNLLEIISYLLSRGGASQAYVYEEILKQCSLETRHAGFSGVLFALSVVQVTISISCAILFSV
jgi:membrane associated rhomboid family serine protease